MPTFFEVHGGEHAGTTAASRARHAITRAIAELTFAPGAIVSERELCEVTGFGRAPVREALQRLAAIGLITPRMGSGYAIAPITGNRTRSLFEVWRTVEPAAAAAAVRRGRAVVVVQRFRQGIAAFADMAPPVIGDDEAVLETLRHVLLVAVCENYWFTQLLASAAPELERLFRFAQRLGADLGGLDAAHDDLVDAVEAGDVEAVQRVSVAHIDDLERVVLDALLNSDANLAVDDDGARTEWRTEATDR